MFCCEHTTSAAMEEFLTYMRQLKAHKPDAPIEPQVEKLNADEKRTLR